MSDQPKPSIGNIVVGVAFDQFAASLLHLAADLARRTGAGLRVVDVVHPLPPRPIYLPVEVEGWEVEGVLSEERSAVVKGAWDKVASLVSQMPADISCQGNVIEALTVPEALCADATAHGGTLIIVGAASSPRGFVPKGMSTALSLMRTASVPVLAVRHDSGLTFAKNTFKILIADDLTAACEPAVSSALMLAKALGQIEVVHTHVIDSTFNQLLRRHEDQRHEDAPERPRGGEIGELVEQRVHEILRSRAGSVQSFEVRGSRYETQVLSGNPRAEIAAALMHFSPDVAVFGRHHALHRHPFGIGHVPFSAMLEGKWGVMVAGER